MRTLKEYLMLVLCLLYAVLRGSARRKTILSKDARIVVVQLAKLGDMVCTTPVFRAIKEACPQAHLTVIGNSINREVLAGNMDVDEYLVFDGIMSVARALRSARYDFGLITAPSMATFTALFFGNVRAITIPTITEGKSPLETLAYRMVRPLAFVEPHRMGHYAPREYLRLLHPIGITTTDTTKHLAYTDAARAVALQKLGTGLLIGIAPSAGNRIKQWPPERFGEVADHLIERYGARIVLIGSTADRNEADTMLGAMTRTDGVIDLIGMLSIDELKAVVAQLNLFISVDTGPIYIAEAYGIPTIDIVGPMDEREQPPVSERHHVIVPTDRSAPALHIMNARWYDRAEAERQARATTAREVIRVADSVLTQAV